MNERPNVPQILADALRAAGVDNLTAAQILVEVGQAIEAQRQWDDMERWRGQPTVDEPDERLPDCVERWPECRTGDYDPHCCRFPKSCSCTVYDRDTTATGGGP